MAKIIEITYNDRKSNLYATSWHRWC